MANGSVSPETAFASIQDGMVFLRSLELDHPRIAGTAFRLREILKGDAWLAWLAIELRVTAATERHGHEEGVCNTNAPYLVTLREVQQEIYRHQKSVARDREWCIARIREYLMAIGYIESELEEADDQKTTKGRAPTQSEPPTPKGFEGLKAKDTDLSRYLDPARLTDRQHDCYSLRFEYGLPLGDVARRLGIHRKTVDEHLALANKKLQEYSAREGKLKRTSSPE